jgi:hypothetical protein
MTNQISGHLLSVQMIHDMELVTYRLVPYLAYQF